MKRNVDIYFSKRIKLFYSFVRQKQYQFTKTQKKGFVYI